MKRQKKQLLSLLLAVALVFSLLPAQVFAASGDTARVLVTDVNGNVIPNATVTVEQRNYTIFSWQDVTVNNAQAAQGIYTFTSAGNRYYRITVTAPGYKDYTYTTAKTNPNNSTTFTATLEEEGAEYVTFEVFYYLSGSEEKPFPDSYYGSGDVGNYGPSRNDTPLVTIQVDIAKLRRMPDVVEGESGGNFYFIPANTNQDVAAAEKFWASVWECVTDSSKEAFEATGLAKEFVGYCLKEQSNNDYHMDGILKVTPPVYVIEMYYKEGNTETYFAGEAVDATHPGMDVYDVLAFCENYIGRTITWQEDELGRPALVEGKDGEKYYQGTYVTDTHLYNVTISQRDMQTPTDHVSGLRYDKISEQYYLAQFVVEVAQVQKLVHTVVYTDGVADEVVYNDHTYAVDNGENVPAFTGIYTRKGYTFAGWVLEGGDGTVLSDAQAQALKVTGDMVFHAVWQIVPKYEGRVELVLDGTYDSATHTATGDRISAETIRGAGTKLYVKEENAADIAENYILLDATDETGVYTAQLENGNYYFFYSVDNGATKISTGNQLLTINNENRTRYLFYNSVTYDLNGGSGGPSALTEYHRSGYSVNVSDAVPTREGYVFLGWKDQYQTEEDKPHQSGAVLTADIGKAYTLVAQWDTITRAKVNLHLEIVHTVVDQGTDPETEGNLEINLMYRPKNSNEPYVEVVGDMEARTVTYTKTGDSVKTTTVTYSDIFSDLPTDHEYSANAFLDHYYNVERTVTATVDAEGNVTYDVNIRLQFDPDLFHLQFDVVADSSIPDGLIPKAVDIKVLSYDAQTPNAWAPISRHQDYSVDVLLDGRTGSGSYNVLAHRTDGSHYYYRLRPAGFTLADGTELVTTKVLQEDGISYIHYSDPSGKYPQGAFYAIVTVTGGNTPAKDVLPGVYAVAATEGDTHSEHVQKGTLTVTVYANPRKVTFNPNGGSLNGSAENTVLENQFFIPDLQNYIPTRDGGYVFDGWYLADEKGNITATQAVSNTGITEDATLIAKWREPITIQGDISVDGGFYLPEDDTFHIIQDAGRLQQVVVALQHIDANGYAETYHTQTVRLTYKDVDVDGDGDVDYYNLGLGNYEFTGVHDEDHDHRILILAPNYSTLYHNEASEGKIYDAESFLAVDENEDKVEQVDAHLSFTPDSFNLQYTVDASKIGASFRPNCAEVLVTCDTDPLIVVPDQWPVISQMVFGEENIGIHTKLDAAGKGSGSLSVWKTFPDGATVYDYGIRVEMTEQNEVETVYDAATSTFTIEYIAPAHWTGSEQSQLLQATLIPKQYPIHYELSGGSVTASCPTAHTWSYETDLSKAIPVREGYAFEGWYLDAGLTEKAPATISAETAEETTLYAKWAEAHDQVNLHVTVNHMHHEGGETDSYVQPLVVTLKRTDRGGAEYTAVADHKKEYGPVYWHTVGDGADVEESYIVPVFSGLSELYDYTLDVSMEGYTLAEEPKVARIVDEETGATTHEVTVTLQFAPDLLYIDFTVQMDEDTKPWLDPEYVNVKVTCWYELDGVYGWYPISQHAKTSVQVEMNGRTGTGRCPVWQWEDEENKLPWYYRIEPVELVFANGTVIPLAGDSVTYTGGNYTAQVSTDENCVNPDGASLSGVHGVENGEHFVQSGTIKAVISATEHSVVFHTNLDRQADVFRTYVPFEAVGDYQLTEKGTIEATYDLPTFDATTHNKYIFKGWYLDPDKDSRPIRFDGAEDATVFAGVTDIYAHWIEVGEVAKNPEDGKDYDSNYRGFDLVGVQIREDNTNQSQSPSYHGTAGAGLRFVAVLSRNVFTQIENLSEDNPIATGAKPMEYGFVVATESAATRNANGKNDYTLQYKGVVNGVNTREDYSYAVNMVCSGPTIIDHYSDETYRLFTAVITYKGSSAETQKGREFVARAYLRYNDANGLYRTHYNNYTGTNVYGGVCVSYNGAVELLKTTQ